MLTHGDSQVAMWVKHTQYRDHFTLGPMLEMAIVAERGSNGETCARRTNVSRPAGRPRRARHVNVYARLSCFCEFLPD